MSAIAELLLADLRDLRVKAYEPGCWLLKVSLFPWRSKRSQAERDAFLARVVNRFKTTAWGIDPINIDAGSRTDGGLAWITSAGQVPPVIRDKSYLGNWSALLFARVTPDVSTLPRYMALSARACQEAKRILESTGADVLLFSTPDDVEWLLVERL